MFDLLGLLIQAFIILWLVIIATIPQVMMGGLTLCVAATVITYFTKKA